MSQFSLPLSHSLVPPQRLLDLDLGVKQQLQDWMPPKCPCSPGPRGPHSGGNLATIVRLMLLFSPDRLPHFPSSHHHIQPACGQVVSTWGAFPWRGNSLSQKIEGRDLPAPTVRACPSLQKAFPGLSQTRGQASSPPPEDSQKVS